MDCQEVQAQLIEYFYEEISPETEIVLLRHLEQCEQCAQEYQQLKETLQVLDRWEVSPPPGLFERILTTVQQTGISRAFSWRQRVEHPPPLSVLQQLVISAIVGSGATVGSILFLTRILPSRPPLSTSALLICGAIWGVLYVTLFGLASAQSDSRFSRIRSLARTARVTLVALGIATLMLGGGLFLQRLSFGALELVLNSVLGEIHSWGGYFVLGGLTALFALFLGTIIIGPSTTTQPISHTLLASCFFTMAVAPGLTILCLPFTLGIYLSAVAGSGVGALLGGSLGSLVLWQGTRAV